MDSLQTVIDDMVVRTHNAVDKAKGRLMRHKRIKTPTITEYLQGLSALIVRLSQGVVEYKTEQMSKLELLQADVNRVLSECCDRKAESTVEQCTKQFRVEAEQLQTLKQELKQTLQTVMDEKLSTFSSIKQLHSDVVRDVAASFKEYMRTRDQGEREWLTGQKKEIQEEIQKFAAKLSLERTQLQAVMTPALIQSENSVEQITTLITRFEAAILRLEALSPTVQLVHTAVEQIKRNTDSIGSSIVTIAEERDGMLDSITQKLSGVVQLAVSARTTAQQAIQEAGTALDTNSAKLGESANNLVSATNELVSKVAASTDNVKREVNQSASDATKKIQTTIEEGVTSVRDAVTNAGKLLDEKRQRVTATLNKEVDGQQKLLNTQISLLQQAQTGNQQTAKGLEDLMTKLDTKVSSIEEVMAQRVAASVDLSSTADQIAERASLVMQDVLSKALDKVGTNQTETVRQLALLQQEISQTRDIINRQQSEKNELMLDEARTTDLAQRIYAEIQVQLIKYTTEQVAAYEGALTAASSKYFVNWQNSLNELNKLQASRLEQVATYEQEITRQTQQLQQLQTSIVDERNSVRALQQEQKLLSMQVKNDNNELTSLAKQSEVQNNKFRDLTVAIGTLESRIISAKESLVVLDDELVQKKRHVADESAKLDKELQKMSDMYHSGQTEVLQKQRELELAKSVLADKEAEIRRCTEEINSSQDKIRAQQSKLTALQQKIKDQVILEATNKALAEKELQRLEIQKMAFKEEIQANEEIRQIIKNRDDEVKSTMSKRDSKYIQKTPTQKFVPSHLDQIAQTQWSVPEAKSQQQSLDNVLQKESQRNQPQVTSLRLPLKAQDDSDINMGYQKELDLEQDAQYFPLKSDRYTRPKRAWEQEESKDISQHGQGSIQQPSTQNIEISSDDRSSEGKLQQDLQLILYEAQKDVKSDINWLAIALGVAGVGVVGGLVAAHWKRNKRRSYSDF